MFFFFFYLLLFAIAPLLSNCCVIFISSEWASQVALYLSWKTPRSFPNCQHKFICLAKQFRPILPRHFDACLVLHFLTISLFLACLLFWMIIFWRVCVGGSHVMRQKKKKRKGAWRQSFYAKITSHKHLPLPFAHFRAQAFWKDKKYGGVTNKEW